MIYKEYIVADNLTDRLVAEIEKKIVTEEWSVGDKIPTLREMVSLFGVSRSVVNAAISELDSAGYLKIEPRKRITVSDWRREGTLAVLGGITRENAFDEKTLHSLLRSRELIETECARLAALNASNKDIDRLKKMIIRGRTLSGNAEKTEYDIKFHHQIAIASGNMVYALIIKSFEKYSREFVRKFYDSGEFFEFATNKHQEIVDAIERKLPESAEEKMRELLAHGEDIITLISGKNNK